MNVILNEDVANLGEEGDIRSVAAGYARNFLLPKGLVLADNARNRAIIDERRADIDARKSAKRKEAASMKENIERDALQIEMTAGANGKLFGSVTASTIVEQLASRGIAIERKRIDVPDHSIKTTGNFKVRVKLYGDEEAILTVSVSSTAPAEAKEDKETSTTTTGAATAHAEDANVTDAESDELATVTDPAQLDPEVMAMQAAADEAADAEE